MELIPPCEVRQAVINNSYICHILITVIRAMDSALWKDKGEEGINSKRYYVRSSGSQLIMMMITIANMNHC